MTYYKLLFLRNLNNVRYTSLLRNETIDLMGFHFLKRVFLFVLVVLSLTIVFEKVAKSERMLYLINIRWKIKWGIFIKGKEETNDYIWLCP